MGELSFYYFVAFKWHPVETIYRWILPRFKNIIADTVLLLHKAFAQCVFGILSKMQLQVNYFVDKLQKRARNKFKRVERSALEGNFK